MAQNGFFLWYTNILINRPSSLIEGLRLNVVTYYLLYYLAYLAQKEIINLECSNYLWKHIIVDMLMSNWGKIRIY